MPTTVVLVVLAVPVVLLVFHTLVRIVRHFVKFPMPEFLAGLIDNPLRRRIHPPAEMPLRHAIEPGMTVLEVGPGNGRYTVETARRVGDTGRVVAVDIEPAIVERVTERARSEGVGNLHARVADVHVLPFDDGEFDAIAMIAVIGEIPEPHRAMREFHCVLKPGGTLAFSEVLMDPDYPRARTLVRLACATGFRLREKTGGFFSYTVVFEKEPPMEAEP